MFIDLERWRRKTMEQIPPSDDAATTNPHRFEASEGPRILGPNDGKAADFGSFGVRFMIWSEESGGGFSLVEHPIPPRTLAAPLHRHTNEDEYSYVLEGRMGAQLGDEVVYDSMERLCEEHGLNFPVEG